MSTGIILMSRAPIPGKTKTRLHTHLSIDEAAEIHKVFLKDICQILLTLSDDNDINLYLSYTPEGNRARFKGIVPEGFSFFPQEGENLGERMYNSLNRVRVTNEKQLIIGSDLPYLQPGLLLGAINELEEKDVIIGPSNDGGYYLLGIKEDLPYLFEKNSWGSNEVLQNTIELIQSKGKYNYSLLGKSEDVDTFADLEKLYKALQAPTNWQYYPRHTARYLEYLQKKRVIFDGRN